MKKRILLLGLALLLLAGCGPAGRVETPPPSRAPLADKLTWVHGFYAVLSYDQIDLAEEMDAVSLGWGRMDFTEDGTPWINHTPSGGNAWVVPEGAEIVKERLDAKGVPYNLCVYCGAGSGEDNALENALTPARREETARVLAAAAEGYHGLTVDFEGLRDGNGARENYPALLRRVRELLPEDKSLFIAIPPDTWYRGYDYRALGRECDKVIFMAHSYHLTQYSAEYLGNKPPDNPPAPIGGVEWDLKGLLDPETGLEDPSKAALAISFDTTAAKVDEEGSLIDTEFYAPGSVKLASRLRQPDAELGWSETYGTPWVYYHNEDGERYLVWYEDARSVAAKVDKALELGVTGVSLWRLGLVPHDDGAPWYDIWPAVTDRR